MRPAILSRPVVATLGGVAALAALPSAAGAATKRYEAERYASTGKVQRTGVEAKASGGSFRWLVSTGAIDVNVKTAIKTVTIRVKGTDCYDPTESLTNGPAGFQIQTIPGYHQQDGFLDPNPADYDGRVTSWAAGTDWSSWTFTLPYGGYFAPSLFTGGAPNRVLVRFTNDFRKADGSCDRNLAIDYIDIGY